MHANRARALSMTVAVSTESDENFINTMIFNDLEMILKQNRQKPLCKGHSLNSGQMAMYQSVRY